MQPFSHVRFLSVRFGFVVSTIWHLRHFADDYETLPHIKAWVRNRDWRKMVSGIENRLSCKPSGSWTYRSLGHNRYEPSGACRGRECGEKCPIDMSHFSTICSSSQYMGFLRLRTKLVRKWDWWWRLRNKLLRKLFTKLVNNLQLVQFDAKFPNVSKLLFMVSWRHHIVIMDKFGDDQRTIEEVEGELMRRMEIAEVRKLGKAD